jgi:CRISPR-associated protein Cas1
MATVLLDRSELEVRAIDGALALYENGVRSGTVPIRMIERLIIQGSRTRLDTGVLLKVAESGGTTLLLSPRAGRQVAIVLGPAHNDAAVRLAQAQRVMDTSFCDDWARRIVRSKITRQHALMTSAEQRRPDVRKALFDARVSLDAALLQTGEGQFPPCSRLRGIEGSAARAYFSGYMSLFPPELNFTGRNRRPPRDPVNASLSLAYTLLHFEAVRIAHISGLDPLLGFYHRPAFGRESLASDLIEPLRPLTDEWVWSLFADRTLRGDHFNPDKGACLLGKAGRGYFYAAWERFAPLPRRWLRLRCMALARNMRDQGLPWLEDVDLDDALQ